MDRNPESGCLFGAWVTQFDYWSFRPALFNLSNAALHYIETLVTLIWDNTRVLKADNESSEEVVLAPEIAEVSISECRQAYDVAYLFTCSKMMSLKKGQQFVLARTSQEVDADYRCTFQVLEVNSSSIVARCKARYQNYPPDILQGTWTI